MTQGFVFLLGTLVEAAAVAGLGFWLGRRLELSRSSAVLRCCAAAVIGTGVTHPALWLWLPQIVDLAGSRWGGLAVAQGLVILVETPFYAAALRGHWRHSLGFSVGANLASLAAGLAMSQFMAKPV